MSILFGPPAPQPKKKDDALQGTKNSLRMVRAGTQLASDLAHSNPERAVQRAIVAGLKLSSVDSVFYDELSSPQTLLAKLKELGTEALIWTPECLMATIDQKFGGWTPEKAADAIKSFHDTGFLKTDVPPLVRQKLYAIRLAATNDAPYSEWNVFEKVGAAFNDRLAQFGLVEPLSAEECLKTIIDLAIIRHDDYTSEVKIYIAACMHEAGFYTVRPIPALTQCETYLAQMIADSTGEKQDQAIVQQIDSRYFELKNSGRPAIVEDDLIAVQAQKLLALDSLLPPVVK